MSIDSPPSRFDRMKVEVVSGGTQADEPPERASRDTMIIGLLAWIGLFTFLAFNSPWSLVFVVGLAISIMLHELGHFWTARRSGMKATQFFLGFGPRVWSTHRGGVEYGLRAIPLGGFVKIIGMTNVDEVAPADEPYTYRQATYARRMWVITAGSVMHMIIALTLVVGLYATFGRAEETGTIKIISVGPDTPAQAAGLRIGDVVNTVDGRPVATANELRGILADTAPGTTLTFGLSRDGESLELTAELIQNPNQTATKGYLGVTPSSFDYVRQSVGDSFVDGPRDLLTGVGQAIVGVGKVINPVNVFGHLIGTNTDETSRPGTIVGATRISDDIGRFDGWAGMLYLVAVVNISVGVFNMFPLLPLDGGHAAIATYEKLRSRRGKRYYADVNKLMPVAAVCIALLAFMFLTGLYLDTVKLNG
ncbi:MAG: RIP metalloprotease [Actinobacteria bacterium]|nr:RIP metalloprotease [Actinomycetota bacterium]